MMRITKGINGNLSKYYFLQKPVPFTVSSHHYLLLLENIHCHIFLMIAFYRFLEANLTIHLLSFRDAISRNVS